VQRTRALQGARGSRLLVDLYPTVMRIVSDYAGGGGSEAPIPRGRSALPV
jgi:hypothetical protein